VSNLSNRLVRLGQYEEAADLAQHCNSACLGLSTPTH
jgi:hypothetical protein